VSVPIVTGLTGAEWEADVVADLARAGRGLTIVRRCVDLTELLSVAESGVPRAALVHAGLRRLNRDAIERLHSSGVVVVGLVDPRDPDAGHRLRRLGVQRVVPADAGLAAIGTAISAGISGRVDFAAEGAPVGVTLDDAAIRPPPPPPGRGRMIAIWGPTGAPGRTTLAVGLADEIARLGVTSLLVDADVYGGTVAAMLGLLDESAAVAAACRLAGDGRLDTAGLAALARRLSPTLSVLTGLARADRWPEVRPAALTAVLAEARRFAVVTVVDCAFCLEQDEELSYDTAAPRRNGATLTVLAEADTIVCVGGADPIGLHRLVRALGELAEVVPEPGNRPVVVNRVRPGRRSDRHDEVVAFLRRWAGVTDVTQLPADWVAVERALRTGSTLAEIAPDSALRLAIAELARRIVGAPTAPGRRARRRGLSLAHR
jgi:Flp pilus assembly CpaE family ATPase